MNFRVFDVNIKANFCGRIFCMKFEILLNRVLRLPLKKAIEEVDKYRQENPDLNFYEQQRVMDIIAQKSNFNRRVKEEVIRDSMLYLILMTKEASPFRAAAFDEMKKYPMIIWMEGIGAMDTRGIMALLRNYHREFTSPIIETCIINLPEKEQLFAIDKYGRSLDPNGQMFSSFYYSISDSARSKLRDRFPCEFAQDILLELEDLDEKTVIDRLDKDRDKLAKIPANDLIEFILLKASCPEMLNIFFRLYADKIDECPVLKFELLFTRYVFLRDKTVRGELSKSDWSWTSEDEKKLNLYTDFELFSLFKKKFHDIGLHDTLSLFDKNDSEYLSNKFTVAVTLEFLDSAFQDEKETKYFNDETIREIIKRFVKKCNDREYSIEEFQSLVRKAGTYEKRKLIYDDYIEAIVACGKLLKKRVISDEDPCFLELRDKFTKDLFDRCSKDGTYMDVISLNGLFYRLAKGSIPFDIVYMTKTYKGIIYLSKCGPVESADDPSKFGNIWDEIDCEDEDPYAYLLVDSKTSREMDADAITKYLTDEQLAKLNTTPVLRWKKSVIRKSVNADGPFFMERMGLQLLCYFGRDKGKYLLESDLQGNNMENLFDGLNYKDISIDIKGEANINSTLIDFLFGRGMMKEPKSVINRMIQGEIPEFKKYFTSFCKDFHTIFSACNGVLSVKRIVRHFEEATLPIELNPGEVAYRQALKEMNTLDKTLLLEAVGLCNDARERYHSTIPKVEGQLGKFTYKVLDLDDPLAVAVGYLTHCCFVVRGDSYFALKHSMQSQNGRTFVVYYDGKLLTQSWIWRNGDVICFDSVESGSPVHKYKDDIKLVDVYKEAASKMMEISFEEEDDIQRVKTITVGRSDYTFNGLDKVQGSVPCPLEKNVYIYDSRDQWILAGSMPDEPRYGVVGAQYRDPRKKTIIEDLKGIDIDTADAISDVINAFRYRIYGITEPVDLASYTKVFLGDGWYILETDGEVSENGALKGDDDAKCEMDTYMSRYRSNKGNDDKPKMHIITPLIGRKDGRK